MERFKRLVLVDKTGITEFILDDLKRFADEVISYEDFPTESEIICQRIEDADAILLSWNTTLTYEILSKCKKLKYIGLCCTYFDGSSCNVDSVYCRENDIEITGVRDYGDEGVVEYVISELIQMVKGLGSIVFYDEQRELGHMKLGVIGLGTVGKLVADAAAYFGMDVRYFNRKERKDVLYPYMKMDDLLQWSDVIMTSIPRNQIVMGESEFSLMNGRKIFINVGVGPSFDQQSLERWIEEGNYAILDAGSIYEEKRSWYENHPRISISKHIAGFTWNARQRLGKKVVSNIESFLDTKNSK